MSDPLDDAIGFGKGLGSGVYDGAKSMVEGAVDLAKGGYHLATDPDARRQAWETTKQLAKAGKDLAGRVQDDPAQAYRDAKNGANNLYTAFDKARADAATRGESGEFWGKAVGRGGFEVASLALPFLGEAGKVAEVGKVTEAGSAVLKTEKVLSSTAKALDAGVEVLPCGKIVANTSREFSAIDPGPLADRLAETFSGGRYREVILSEDTILRRVGTADEPLGRFFSTQSADSVVQARIDRAILPRWTSGAESPIDTEFEILFPKGTKVYIGKVGSQGGFYVGGTEQIVIPNPWTIDNLKIVPKSILK